MDLGVINGRVDQALGDNRRAETIVIIMAIAIFVLGAAAFVFAYWRQNPYVAGGGLLFQALLYLADSRGVEAPTRQSDLADSARTRFKPTRR